MKNNYKCCICGKKFKGYGNNAQPLREGVCCDNCNERYVIPARIAKRIAFEICNDEKDDEGK